MTDEQIIKALDCCFNPKVGEECPRKVKGLTCNDSCERILVIDALDLINRKDGEIEKLNVELVGMRGACESYKMHYDKAQAEIAELKSDLMLKTNNYELLKRAYEQAENVSNGRKDRLMQKVVELQEARKEIERLENSLSTFKSCYESLTDMYENAKCEAIKDFAEKYKEHIKNFTGRFTDGMGFMVNLDAILFAVDFVADNLVKEMTEPVKIEHNSLCETETYMGE